MGFVVIPAGYDPAQDSGVPICMQDEDDNGHPLPPVWIDAVRRIHKCLCNVAQSILGDPWLASELVDITARKLARRHGPNGGKNPARRFYVRAVWEEKDLAAGGKWLRRHRYVFRSLESVDFVDREARRTATEEVYIRKIMLDSLDTKLNNDRQQAFRLLRYGWEWHEMQLEKPADKAFRTSLWRSLRRSGI